MFRVFHFTRQHWLAAAFGALFVASFPAYVWSEKKIDDANEVRHRSALLAQELRQSSDDLTRMARSYAATGDPRYRRQYEEVFDIRAGRRPRPLQYQLVYWDLVLQEDQRPRGYGPQVALLDLIRQAGFSAQEIALLERAKANSDALGELERVTMAQVDATSSPAQRMAAQARLYDEPYMKAKAAIMAPILEFQQVSDRRTRIAVDNAATLATLMRSALVATGLTLMFLLLGLVQRLRAVLGGSVQDLHRHIVMLGQGDFVTPVPVPPRRESSVMGWLSETRLKLAKMDGDRARAEASTQRLTQLYAALSHCNQIIVRCKTESELFNQICENIVIRGGMKMAWVGLLDGTGALQPVASHGDGIGYLDGVHITADADSPSGQGPSGVALRENYAVWCQDFQHAAATRPWQELGMRYGWRSSGSLPLHRDGKVIGAVTIYANVPHAFETDVRNLLLEMASDIDYALKNLDRERQREQSGLALQKSEQHLRTIIETEPEGIIVVDSAGRVLDMNPAGLAMLEADSLYLLQQRAILDAVLPSYRDAFRLLHRNAIGGVGGMLEFEMRGLRGTARWFEIHAAPLRGADGLLTMLGIVRDITPRKQAEERILYLAHTDYLTGLPNRVRLSQVAAATFDKVRRRQGQAALMFLDLDCFKDINDALGHSIGDAVLVQLARRLSASIGPGDCAARLGGDEFVLLYEDAGGQGAALLAQRLLDLVRAPFHVEQYDLNLSGSVGIALYPDDGGELEMLFQCADAAMYSAKREGRDGYRFFSNEMQAHFARQLELVSALRHALGADQLQIHYQPQVDAATGRLTGAEALLRWTHPLLGGVSPAEFIPAAEASGLMLPLGEWVLRHAVRQAVQWQKDGLPPFRIAVNLSAVQFRQPDLPELVARILAEEGLAPGQLELELTEGAAMEDPQRAADMMSSLHARGVDMSIDDFGTGYSSLSKLKKFKISKLKIDRSFVCDICTDPEDQAIVAAIISMARSLGMSTIAEGVETAEQLAMLRAQGCNEIQGYYYSKPLPADQFSQFALARA